MTPELWQRLKPLYNAALEMPTERRGRFIADVGSTDAQLGSELEALLAANKEGTRSFDEPFLRRGEVYPTTKETFFGGEVIEGRFRIIRPIGSGGMGDVYEAQDLLLQTGRIALKTIRASVASDPATLSRFKQEVLLARQITGTNVCRIYELYVSPNPVGGGSQAFLTMEFLEGMTLADRIASDGAIAPQKALAIATQLCTALQSIHAAGVIHRDLKPRNIMLAPRAGVEQAVVMDFGLARAFVGGSSATGGVTVAGSIMGTPAYMAPEQFEGGKVSFATDIYALGIVLYELITGKEAFAAHTPFGAAVRRGRRPDPPSSVRKGVPPVWDDVIAKCLEYDQECRYQSAGEVIAALSQRRITIFRFQSGLRLSLGRTAVALISASLLAGLMAVAWLRYQASLIHEPPVEARRWYDRGITALREGTYLEATKALGMALSFDNRFALAHARLADALAELDFTGEAQSEMLIATAPDQQRSLTEIDRQYVDAVRATLVRNYSAAAQDYEAILKKLPEDQKADGYVDLGRAYEKSGKVKETIDSYEKAAKLRPDDPAPFVHLGIWKSRQRDPVGAEAAFVKAEALYEAGSNLEGQAEVDYQRGYAANEASDTAHARLYLEKTLVIARQIHSAQLEVRTLSQLSSVEYNSGHADKAIEYANQTITLARQNGLDYWEADGLMRLGNAYFTKGDLANAESYSQQALGLARRDQHPRLTADSELTLASIRDRQGKSDEQIAFAQDALGYFRDFGFMGPADDASILVVRGQLAKGNFSEALDSGTGLLEIARKTHSESAIEEAEDAVGAAANDLQDYPAALVHFEEALKASESLHQYEEYQYLFCADNLWRLGRYQEAQKMLSAVPIEARKQDNIGASIADVLAPMLLSQNDYRAALLASRDAFRKYPSMPPDQIADLRVVEAIADTQLGQGQQAEQDAEQLLAAARQQANDAQIAQAQLVRAQVFLNMRSPQEAAEAAQQAYTYYSSKKVKASQWISLLYLSQAAKMSGDTASSEKKAAQAIDILNDLQQSWSPPVFHQYATRPDNQVAINELEKLKSE